MRKEIFGIGDYVHVYNRGNRKQPIVQDIKDREHFLHMLYYFNTEITPPNPFAELKSLRPGLNDLKWPDSWKPRKEIVKILAFTLINNHYHLVLNEIVDGGIAKFMQRFGTGMTMYYNTKNQESGRLFQGVYKAKPVDSDLYLKYLSVYVQVKNIFELYPGGLDKAIKEFEKAYKFSLDYRYSSLGSYWGDLDNPALDKTLIMSIFPNASTYKDFSKECINVLEEKLKNLTLE